MASGLFTKGSSSDEDETANLMDTMFSENQTRRLLALAPVYLKKKIMAHHASCKLRQLAEQKKLLSLDCSRDDGELSYEEIYSVVDVYGKRFKKDSRLWLHKSWRKQNKQFLRSIASNNNSVAEVQSEVSCQCRAENLNLSCCTKEKSGIHGTKDGCIINTVSAGKTETRMQSEVVLECVQDHPQRPNSPKRHGDELDEAKSKRRKGSPSDSDSFFGVVNSDEEVERLLDEKTNVFESFNLSNDDNCNSLYVGYPGKDQRRQNWNCQSVLVPQEDTKLQFVESGWELCENIDLNNVGSEEIVCTIREDEEREHMEPGSPLCGSPTCSICEEYSHWCGRSPPSTPPCSPWGRVLYSVSEDDSTGFEVTKSSSSLCLVRSPSYAET